MVFSTSLGPRPGACVPTTSTGGVSSGNVSTLMRGVTTNANTTTADAGHEHRDRVAQRERGHWARPSPAATLSPSSSSARPVDARSRCRRQRLGIDEQVAPALARAPAPPACARRRRAPRTPSPSRRAPSPRGAAARRPAAAFRPSMLRSAVAPTGMVRLGSATSISKCTVRVERSAAGARRLMVALSLRSMASSSMWTGVPGAHDGEVGFGRVGEMRTGWSSDRPPSSPACPGARRRPDRRSAPITSPVERRAQDAVVDLEASATPATPRMLSDVRLLRRGARAQLLELVGRGEAALLPSPWCAAASCSAADLALVDRSAPAPRSGATPPTRCGSRASPAPRRA